MKLIIDVLKFILSICIDVTTTACGGNTATGDVDYFSLTNEAITFYATDTSQTVDIYIKNDNGLDYQNETFCVHLDNSCTRGDISAVIGSVTVTIRNDDSMYFLLNLNTNENKGCQGWDASFLYRT